MGDEKKSCKISTGANAYLGSIVDVIRNSVLIVNTDLAILWRNRAARRLLEAGDMLRSSRGQLRTADGNGQVLFREFLSRIIDSEQSASPEHVMPVKCLKTGRHCELVGFRISTQQIDAQARDDRVAVLFVTDPTQRASIPRRVLESLYGLTECERRLALAMLNGSSLERYATESDISISTVRTHLKSVFRKTDSGNQAALVSLLSRLVPPVDIE